MRCTPPILVWTASGTATLETALLGKPMIIVYRVSWLTYLLARLLVRVDHIGMVNLIAEERLVPELIQSDVNPERLVAESAPSCSTTPRLRTRHDRKIGQAARALGHAGSGRQRVADLALAMMR